MAAKLSKQELKSPDAFQSTFERIGDYVAENRTRVMVFATAFLCAICIALGIYFYWSHYSGSALKLYAKAQENLLKSGDNPQTIKENIPIYQQLIDKYPNSWSGRMAYYHLGNVYYNSGDLEKAISSYRKFVEKSGTDKTGVKFLALTSLGYCYEAKKDFEDALKLYQEAIQVYHVGFEMMGLRNIARVYEELNNKDKALEYYKKALEKATDPSVALFIKRKISALS